jgi:hypothetical protein
VNGGAVVGSSIGAADLPPSFVSTVNALTGVDASGGASRALITGAGGRTVAVGSISGNQATFTISSTWDNTPIAGDTFVIPSTAPAGLIGVTNQNVGAYIVLLATASTVVALKLSDADKPSAVPGTITAPVPAPATALAAATDVQAFAPVTIFVEAGVVVDGIGKSLEIAELTTGADLLSRCCVTSTGAAVAWVSKTSSPQLLVSSAEKQVTLTVNKSADYVSEEITAGGDVGLKVGYAGTTAVMTINSTTLTTTVTGGSGGNLSLTLSSFANLQALAAYINAQTGYKCTVGNASIGFLSTSALDRVAGVGICGQFGTQPGRIKLDAYRFFNEVMGNSALIQLGNPATQVSAGLPDATPSELYLSGGSRGSTSDTAIVNALRALERVRGNFVVPLFSRDASADMVDGLTDSGSTYTIASINANAKSHVKSMSTTKRSRNRQAVVSLTDTFANQREASANLASYRVDCSFLDCIDTGANGVLKQFQPWMLAAKAGAMQCGGFYKSIEYKLINCSGIVHHVGDFSPKDDTDVENALKAGLLVATPSDTGGFIWKSDQTTYGKDNNVTLNSTQSVYMADTLSLSAKQNLRDSMVGQTNADVSASAARALVEQVLANALRLKMIAPSDDAPLGYKNLVVRIVGNVCYVNFEAKLNGVIDFVLIDFNVSPPQQTA